MSNMFYRVDKRHFSEGDIINPQTEYERLLEGEKLKLEEMLNKKRPHNIPERSKCLFLFQDLQGALRFYFKYGGFIYGVEAFSSIYHRGDMNKLDNILDLFKVVDCEKDTTGIIEAAVNYYWKNGTHTFNPCYEILVDSAKTLEVLCSNKDKDFFRKEMNEYGIIEKTSLYKSLIQKIWKRQES